MASILVIDDDAPIRQVLAEILTRHGHRVREAEHGIAGVKLYREEPADLVITDMVMPEKEGVSTILELREIDSAVRIIAISGGMAQDPELYLQLAEGLGADRVLRKPFLLTELITLVSEVLALPRPPPTR